MCYRPLHLFTPSSNFVEGAPSSYDVACGNCHECNSQKSLDWYIRAYSEYVSHPNWTCVTYTLTFDDVHLPHFKHVSCFDFSEFQKFIKRLRFHLPKNFEFSYFVVSEFGSLFSRPHHHILFYFPKEFTSKSFYQAVLKSWQNGYIHFSTGTQYGIIKSVSALSYVCKYITKDITFTSRKINFLVALDFARKYSDFLQTYAFKNPLSHKFPSSSRGLKALIKYMRKNREFRDSRDYKFLWDFYLLFNRVRNRYLPFHTCSHGFGSSLPSIDYNNLSLTVLLGNSYVKVSLPNYLRRKLFYHRVFNPRTGKNDLYRLTEEGCEILSKSVLNSLSEKSLSISSNILSIPSSADEYKLNYLRTFPYDLKKVVMYFNYRNSSLNLINFINSNIDIFSIEFFEKFIYNQFVKRSLNVDFSISSSLRSKLISRSKTFCEYFADFELFYMYYNDLLNQFKCDIATSRHEREMQFRHASQIRKLQHYKQTKHLISKSFAYETIS